MTHTRVGTPALPVFTAHAGVTAPDSSAFTAHARVRRARGDRSGRPQSLNVAIAVSPLFTFTVFDLIAPPEGLHITL